MLCLQESHLTALGNTLKTLRLKNFTSTAELPNNLVKIFIIMKLDRLTDLMTQRYSCLKSYLER